MESLRQAQFRSLATRFDKRTVSPSVAPARIELAPVAPARPAPSLAGLKPIPNASIEEAWQLLDDLPSPIRVIQKYVRNYFGLTEIQFLSVRRTMDVVRPRQISMFLCREMTGRSLPEIGRRHGGMDHSTVFHAFAIISKLEGCDEEIRRQLGELRRLIQSRSFDARKDRLQYRAETESEQ